MDCKKVWEQGMEKILVRVKGNIRKGWNVELDWRNQDRKVKELPEARVEAISAADTGCKVPGLED